MEVGELFFYGNGHFHYHHHIQLQLNAKESTLSFKQSIQNQQLNKTVTGKNPNDIYQ